MATNELELIDNWPSTAALQRSIRREQAKGKLMSFRKGEKSHGTKRANQSRLRKYKSQFGRRAIGERSKQGV